MLFLLNGSAETETYLPVSVACLVSEFPLSFTLCLFIILLVRFWLLSGHLLGNSYPLNWPFVLIVFCQFVIFFFHFGIRSGIWRLIAPVPVNCFSITFIFVFVHNARHLFYNLSICCSKDSYSFFYFRVVIMLAVISTAWNVTCRANIIRSKAILVSFVANNFEINFMLPFM